MSYSKSRDKDISLYTSLRHISFFQKKNMVPVQLNNRTVLESSL